MISTCCNKFVIEEDIIKGCIEGKREFQKRLYEIFSGKMFFVCYRYCKNNEEAEDILQDGFVKVFRNIQMFRFDGSFEGWVRRIMVNTAIEHLRKKKHTYAFENVESFMELTENESDITGKFDEKELLKVIHLLPDGYRTVFNLFVIEGYSHKEIAETLSIAEGTSKSQLSKAKEFLKPLLHKYLDIEISR